jgi:SnoaL-like domain
MARRSNAGTRAKVLSLASKFAALLDRDQFTAARRLMAPRCKYRFRGGTIVGADKILDMYRANSVKGRKVLDELRYESKAEGMRCGAVSILYSDHLRKGRHTHTHRCRQFLQISRDKVVAIRHSDLKGERKGLGRFFEAAGVHWR